jgi:2'-hydroxyisoflavone reductase
MSVTPFRQTISDLLAWDRDRGEPVLRTGLSAEAEAELLRRR